MNLVNTDRPAMNGTQRVPGYRTMPAQAGFSLRCSVALWL